MKKIYLSEDKVKSIIPSVAKEEEFTFFKFFYNVKKFIEDLLKDPIHAKPSEVLVKNGLTNDVLRQRLQDENIVVRKQRIDEPKDEVTGKITSRYYVTYKVPRKDFKKNLTNAKFYDNIT